MIGNNRIYGENADMREKRAENEQSIIGMAKNSYIK